VPFARSTSARRLRFAFADADAIHTHLVHADFLGGLLRGRRTLFSTKHNDDPFRTRVPFRLLERGLAARAARVICITDALRRFNVERVGLPAAKLEVVHYGMDEPPAAWAPNELELPEGRLVVAVARLEPQKGLDVAVRAMAGLDATLVVLGVGPERERLEALAGELDVRLLLPGRVGDVASVLRRADLLVHPARWEGFGLALLEAMLCSLPVVATRVSSIPEIVADGETGLLVPPDDVAALAAALRRVLADPGTMGVAGLARARSEFSVARMAERTIAVYASSSDAR
jgi:glycosyltransferase involved in cell wall biosynthesis